MSDQLWKPPSLPFDVGRTSLSGEKRLGHGVHQSPPSSVEVKNERSYSANFPIYLHGVAEDKFAIPNQVIGLINFECREDTEQ
jgi:hypothetical protein